MVFRTEGDAGAVLAADALLEAHRADWLVREVRLLLKRVLKRVDLTSRSLVALIEPGSCFAGTLAELAFAADRSVMLRRTGRRLAVSALNFGAYPMSNGLTRLADSVSGRAGSVGRAQAAIGRVAGWRRRRKR